MRRFKMQARFILLTVLLAILLGTLLYAEDVTGKVTPPAYLTPEQIDPYAFQIHTPDTWRRGCP